LAIGGGIGLLVLTWRRLERLEHKLDEALIPSASAFPLEREHTHHAFSLEREHSHHGSSQEFPRMVRQKSSLSTVVRAVFTGGPCGGKSTGLAQATERLHELGVQVYVVPEASTMMFTAGCPFPVASPSPVQLAWEGAKMRVQESMEGEFRNVAMAEGTPTLILCDRGMMDSKAYTGSEEDWETLLEENSWSEEKLLNRYDIVVHLTTAAYGAEAFFTDANNEARREDAALARILDDKIRAAWKDHPCIEVVDNSTGFGEKIDRVFSFLSTQVLQRTGAKPATGVKAFSSQGSTPEEQTFLITAGSVHDIWPQLTSEVPSQLTYTFLSGGADRVLRRRSRGQTTSHILSTRETGDVTRTARISRPLYRELLVEADPQLSPVELVRYTIVEDGGILVTLDIYTSPQRLQLLSVPTALQKSILEERTKELKLQDISNVGEYTRRGIAAKKASTNGNHA